METRETAQLKLEAFKLAMQLKPQQQFNPMGGSLSTKEYTVADLIKNAEAIFKSITEQ